MKYLKCLPLMGLVFLTMSCGKSSTQSTPAVASINTPSSLVGVWKYTNGSVSDTMTVEAYLGAVGSFCNESVVFTQPDSLGNTVVTVQVTNGASGCLPIGQHSCTISASGTNLTLNCGSPMVYVKQVSGS